MVFPEFNQEKYEQALRNEGEETGKIKYAIQLVKRGSLTLEEAAKDCNMSVQDLEKTMKLWYLF